MQRGQRTNADDIELETTLQELALDLLGDTVYFVSVELFLRACRLCYTPVETNMALWVHGLRLLGAERGHCGYERCESG